ncbi:MAG: hypothetical protein ABIP80_03730, partial [Ferruginibacter sp.]
QVRKATAIAGLKKKILEKKELKNGYAYKFSSTNTDFFSFNTTTSEEKDLRLNITGESGVKDFIMTELDM